MAKNAEALAAARRIVNNEAAAADAKKVAAELLRLEAEPAPAKGGLPRGMRQTKIIHPGTA